MDTNLTTPENVALAQFLTLIGAGKMPKFVAVKGYENKEGAITDYVVNVKAKYSNKVLKDIASLKQYLETFNPETDSALHFQAASKMLEAFEKNQNPETASNGSIAQANAYTRINGAVKLHNENGKFYVYAYVVSRKVLQAAPAKPDKRRPLTIAQDELKRKLKLKTPKYCMFTISYGDTFTVDGKTLTVVPAKKQAAVLA